MMMGSGFLGMFLFWGALLVLLVGGVVLALRQTTGIRLSGGPGQSAAGQILDERFARGEISREAYDAIRTRIEG